MNEDSPIPDPPSFSDDDLRRCKETGDYKPILFEWYKFVGAMAFVVCNIQKDSHAFRDVPAQQYHVLVGLINRCARLMLSNVALSHEGKFGETTAIIDRCIFESAIKVIWLCTNNTREEFVRYFADGLKTEIELKCHIQVNIQSNGGAPLPIEERMLKSIQRHIDAAELTEAEITTSPKLRDLASMINNLGLDRLLYVVAQKIGSHHIHGTWPSLLFHYLEESDDGAITRFCPRGHDCKTHINQYMFVPLIVLHAMAEYARFALDEDCAKAFITTFESTDKEIMKVYSQAGDTAS